MRYSAPLIVVLSLSVLAIFSRVSVEAFSVVLTCVLFVARLNTYLRLKIALLILLSGLFSLLLGSPISVLEPILIFFAQGAMFGLLLLIMDMPTYKEIRNDTRINVYFRKAQWVVLAYLALAIIYWQVVGQSGSRYKFIYSNVLNFTGVACVLYALFSCEAILNRRMTSFYLFGTVLFFLLGVLAASKSMVATGLFSVVLVLSFWKRFSLLGGGFAFLLAVFFANTVFDWQSVGTLFSLSSGAIDHRIARYSRLFEEMSWLGIGLQAMPSICKEIYDVTCVNSESYFLSNIISFGVLGLAQIIVLFGLIVKRVYAALFFIAPLVSNSMGTPYTLLVLYICLLFIMQTKRINSNGG